MSEKINVAQCTGLGLQWVVNIKTFSYFTVPQGTPENVTADRETVSSIRVSWSPVPVGKRQGIINKYNVQVKNKTDVIQNETVEAGNLTVVIDNLEMYVTYFFQVQALTSQGAGPFSLPPVNQTTIQTGMAA